MMRPLLSLSLFLLQFAVCTALSGAALVLLGRLIMGHW